MILHAGLQWGRGHREQTGGHSGEGEGGTSCEVALKHTHYRV